MPPSLPEPLHLSVQWFRGVRGQARMQFTLNDTLLLIQESPAPAWLSYFWPVVMALIFFVLVSAYRSGEEFAQRPFATGLFYSGLLIVCLLFGFVFRVIVAQRADYEVRIDRTAGTLSLADHKGVFYEDRFDRYGAVYKDFVSESSRSSRSRYDLSLVRDDGLLLWLGRYPAPQVQELERFLQLEEITTANNLYRHIHQVQALGVATGSDQSTFAKDWVLPLSPVFVTGFGGMVLVVWIFFIFNILTKQMGVGTQIFAGATILFLTVAFIVAMLSTWRVRKQVSVAGGVVRVESQAPLWFDTRKELDVRGAYIVFGEVGPAKDLGINIFMKNPLDVGRLLGDVWRGSYGGHVRWEGLTLFERIQLFEAIEHQTGGALGE